MLPTSRLRPPREPLFKLPAWAATLRSRFRRSPSLLSAATKKQPTKWSGGADGRSIITIERSSMLSCRAQVAGRSTLGVPEEATPKTDAVTSAAPCCSDRPAATPLRWPSPFSAPIRRARRARRYRRTDRDPSRQNNRRARVRSRDTARPARWPSVPVRADT